MPTNDFLPFAASGGANVVSQDAYATMPTLTTGFQSGVAPSAGVNKTLRQASIMSAVLAQFIADESGANSVDDGTTATLLANLKLGVVGAGGGRPGHAYSASNDWCYLNFAIGLKMQWVTGAIPAATPLTLSFPTPFTSIIFGVVPIKIDKSAETISILDGDSTLTQFTSDNYPGAVDSVVRFLAFGI